MVIVIHTAATVIIHRPIGEVFRFAANPSAFALWVPGAQINVLSTGPFGDGTRFEETLMRFGRPMISTVAVTNYQVNDGFDFQTITAPFPVRASLGSLRCVATADGTQVTLAHHVRVVPWLRPLEPLLQRVSQTQSQRAVQAMKTIVER